MSYVTDVLLLCTCGEDRFDGEIAPPPICAINAWLDGEGFGALNELTEHAGGHKHMQCNVFGGAFNYFRLDDFLEKVRTQAWQDPDDVRILIKEEEDFHFSMYSLERKLA